MFYAAISVLGLAILFLFDWIGVKKGFYGKHGENLLFGKVCHFSGGFLVAVFWTGLINNSLLIILLTFSAGILWEIWEYLYGNYKFKKTGSDKDIPKIPDTVEDLIFDTLGAAVWVLIFINFLINST